MKVKCGAGKVGQGQALHHKCIGHRPRSLGFIHSAVGSTEDFDQSDRPSGHSEKFPLLAMGAMGKARVRLRERW